MKKMKKEFLMSILYSLVLPAIFYFIVKLFQRNFHTILASIDNKIPFIPHFIYFYILFFPFIVYVLYLFFNADKKVYYHCIRSCVLGLIITEIIYLIYPTIIYRPVIDNHIDIITRCLISITYFIDTPAINCFPSIHALLCFIISYGIISSKHINFKYKFVLLGMNFLFLLSTIFVKQHYLYDLIASFLIFSFSTITTSLKFVNCIKINKKG